MCLFFYKTGGQVKYRKQNTIKCKILWQDNLATKYSVSRSSQFIIMALNAVWTDRRVTWLRIDIKKISLKSLNKKGKRRWFEDVRKKKHIGKNITGRKIINKY